jgi:hypothetical protein
MQQLADPERRCMTGGLEGADQSLLGEMERQPWATARRANDSIGYTIQMPHTLRSDPSRYVRSGSASCCIAWSKWWAVALDALGVKMGGDGRNILKAYTSDSSD